MTAPAIVPDRLGLVVHPRRSLDNALAATRAWADAHGAEVVQVPTPAMDRVVAPAGEAATCQLILAMGGDGTVLHALRAAGAHAPVLGVACGSLGALTSVKADRVPAALDAVAAGAWVARPLPGIRARQEDEPPLVALNDLVVVRAGASQVAVGIRIDGELYVQFAGDGVVVATPQGSSAYTLAAGGPVLAPGTKGMVITPLAAHGGTCPPVVAGATSTVELDVAPGHGGARIELDGVVSTLEHGKLALEWVEAQATLVGLGDDETVFAGLRRRLVLRDSPRMLARAERT